MSEYIKKQKAVSVLHLDYRDVVYIDKRETAKLIEAIKGIDIVRCQDCKYWVGNISEDDGIYEDECKWITEEAPNADDYCSYGERR